MGNDENRASWDSKTKYATRTAEEQRGTGNVATTEPNVSGMEWEYQNHVKFTQRGNGMEQIKTLRDSHMWMTLKGSGEITDIWTNATPGNPCGRTHSNGY